jgi:hypothetical protein
MNEARETREAFEKTFPEYRKSEYLADSDTYKLKYVNIMYQMFKAGQQSLKGEVERLREALEGIIAIAKENYNKPEGDGSYGAIVGWAKKALNKKDGE